MLRYRIKTEQEFIKEFGEDWRSKLGLYWGVQMTEKLGQILPQAYNAYCMEGVTVYYSGWNYPEAAYTSLPEASNEREFKVRTNGLLFK